MSESELVAVSIESLPAASSAADAFPAALNHLRALRCLAAVASQGSTLRAAQAVHLSQPAVTRSILELEAAWALQLFERASRGMIPTPAGARVASRVAVLLQQLEAGASEAIAQAGSKDRWAVPERFANAVTASSLRAFTAVAVTGSEKRAAQILGISQPSIHRAARALEQLAGTTLLQASPKGTWLTASGAVMLRRVKLAIAQARAVEADLSAWRGEIRGRIAIGVLPLSVTGFVPKALDAVALRHPDLQLVVTDGTYESLVGQLVSADIDLIVGALRNTELRADIRQEHLFDDDLVIVARKGHPALDTSHSLEDLRKWPWITPLHGSPAADVLMRVFKNAGVAPPSDRLQANSPSMTRALVLDSGRLALTSRSQVQAEERGGQIRIVPMALPETMRRIGMTTRAVGEPSPDLQAVQDALRESAGALVRRDTQI